MGMIKLVAGMGALLLRRVAAAPDLPLAAAASLVCIGLVETLPVPDRTTGDLVQDLVLVVCATAPLAFVHRWVLAAGTSVMAAVLLTMALGRPPTVAALLPLTPA